jgi:hypothetical protein
VAGIAIERGRFLGLFAADSGRDRRAETTKGPPDSSGGPFVFKKRIRRLSGIRTPQ